MLKYLVKLRTLIRERHCPVDYDLEQYERILSDINQKQYSLRRLNDRVLQEKSVHLRKKVLGGTLTEDILTDSFALTSEAALRVLGMQYFTIQLIAGIALHRGNVVDMQTGEGKTLTAVLPAFLNALFGRGVHILTFNDYLAGRDAKWMGPIYEFLGLKVACVLEGMDIITKQKAYGADITYVTAREAGFDYLRDFLCCQKEQLIHRPFHYAIVDEADSIMLDEARLPLVIAGKMNDNKEILSFLSDFVRKLKPGVDYSVDQYDGNVTLTETGLAYVEKELGYDNLYEQNNLDWLAELNSALHAQVLLHRDKDYIVKEDKVEIIDAFTGRIAYNRQWPDNLQAAVEAKEGLNPGNRGTVLGSITMQHFLGLYPRLAGMTGTARSAASEFGNLYGLGVVVVPTNKTCIRKDHCDRVFSTWEGKKKAVLEEIVRVHQKGQPILIGTGSIIESEELAETLRKIGIKCRVLNAKNDALEAGIIAHAGELGAVTVSTNMAGRGVDIKLGGEKEEGRDRVVAAGGLYVLGMQRHESRRIDEQLRGRAGRQGDPGESRFFLSLEDELIRKYDLVKMIPPKYIPVEGELPLNTQIQKALQHGQRLVEGYLSDIRHQLGKYSYLIEQQRKIIHKKRLAVLTHHAPLRLLEDKMPERWNNLVEKYGEETLRQVEMLLTLYYINKCWAEYLEYMYYVRESIHLVVIGRQNPLDEFHRRAIDAFRQMEEEIVIGIVSKFNTMDLDKSINNPVTEEIQVPSATWTYLINDSPDQFSNLPFVIKQTASFVFKPLKLMKSFWRELGDK